MRWLITVLVTVTLAWFSQAAKCGDHDHFEFKFRPLKVGPVKTSDWENAHGRCGRFERHCELLVQIGGHPKCKKGKFGDGLLMKGTEGKNLLTSAGFMPREVGWAVHSDYDIQHAFENPFEIHVCDKDRGLRGSNDEIISVSHQHLTPGCNSYRFAEGDQDVTHPWFIEYEICCREATGRN